MVVNKHYHQKIHLVILYPQIKSQTGENPDGCWNWWGYDNDPNYAFKDGDQMSTVHSMSQYILTGDKKWKNQ